MTARRTAVQVVAIVLVGAAAVGGWYERSKPGAAGSAGDPAQSSRDAGSGNDAIFRLYLDPSGSDSNSGRSRNDPIQSLAKAHDLLRSARPTTDVEVRIAQGTYTAPPIVWRFYVPDHTVTFLPADYAYGGGVDSFAGRPVFRSNGVSGFWFTARPPRGLDGPDGLDSRLRFYYLQVQEYDRGGLMINGGTTVIDGIRRPAGGGLNSNTIVGMYFTHLGSGRTTGTDGYGGVDLVNSSGNTVHHNHFVALVNKDSGKNLIHGVYLAHHSNDNVVQRNNFTEISGDPIRVRNDSNGNEITGNAFERTGLGGQYSDWFCDADCAEREGLPRECASHGNVFQENDNVSGYFGHDIPSWALKPAGANYPGGQGCDNNGDRRVRTSGNT
jgi:hypothetical protein